MRIWSRSDEQHTGLYFGRKFSQSSGLVGYTVLPKSRKEEELHQSLLETASDIDEFTHNVLDWEPWIKSLLDHLEFFARANDPDHPQQYLCLLGRLNESIKKRINEETGEGQKLG